MAGSNDISDNITVTTATQSAEDVRASFGVAAPVEEKPAAPAAPAAAAVADPPADAELEAELDKQEPPTPNETPEQKMARRSRATRAILKQISLRKAAEERADNLARELDTLKRAPRTEPPPPTAVPKADDHAPAAAPAATEFKFPTWDEWSAAHPNAEFVEYTDARSDARDEFKEQKRQADEKKKHDDQRREAALADRKRQFDEMQTHEKAFKAEHQDYDDVIKTLDPLLQTVDDRMIVDFQTLLAKAGALAPKIVYHLGQHPDDAKRLFESPNRTTLTETFGEIKYAAKAAATAAPAAKAEPAEPVVAKPAAQPATAAPAPIADVRGAATTTRTLQQLAEDDEDADAYIASRQKDLRKAG